MGSGEGESIVSEFESFQKIGRLSRDMVITEKLDGTNAQVMIRVLPDDEVMPTDTPLTAVHGNLLFYAGSRTRWITPADDNFGFARWVADNTAELAKLGEGRHFGEWWGQGIQRKYGMKEKRWSLFNIRKWSDEAVRPACCHVVPVLYRGDFNTNDVYLTMSRLADSGSIAAPGFMNPEGVVIFHTQSGALFKKTFERDDAGKGKEPEVVL
jgi:hypothetical protein